MTACQMAKLGSDAYMYSATRHGQGALPTLAHVNVVQQSKVQAEQPPALGEAESKVGSFLGQQPAPQPTPVLDVALEGLQAVYPVVVAWDCEAGGALVLLQRCSGLACPAGENTCLSS